MNKLKQGDYHFEYQEEPIQEDKQVLNEEDRFLMKVHVRVFNDISVIMPKLI